MKNILAPIILSLLLLGCDSNTPPNVVHRHVHQDAALMVYYAPDTGSYYGFNQTTSQWYVYQPAQSTAQAPAQRASSTLETAPAPAPAEQPAQSTVERGGFGATGQNFTNESDKAFGLPPGGGWSKADKPETELQEQPDTHAEITTDQSGEVLSPTVVDQENTQDAQEAAMEAQPASEPANGNTESTSTSSDTGSSSGDSGGSSSGGDGGGGGGE